MTRAEFVDFVRATFNAMDMLTPQEGALAVVKAFHELDTRMQTEDIQSCLKQVSDKWAARCARAELRVAHLQSTIRV